MTAVFRVDASTTIGGGHLMRCLTLANRLRDAGCDSHFICRDLPGNYAAWLRETGHSVTLLPAPLQPIVTSDQYLGWLGVTMEMEISQCLSALDALPVFHWIVVDHYALDSRWESAVNRKNARILVIDDLANRTHECQILLDQNHYPNANRRYNELARHAEMLLGPAYALLRPEFARRRAERCSSSSEVRRLLIFLGGSDNANVTTTVLRALKKVEKPDLEIEVIIGHSNRHRTEIEGHCTFLGARLSLQVDDMADRMANADLAIGATGVATWERAAVGLPTLAVSVADNQREIARHADQLGILRWLGDADRINDQQWVEALEWAFENPQVLRIQSMRGMQFVDGLGTNRVVEKMIEYHRRMH